MRKIIDSKVDIEKEAINFIQNDNLLWLEEIIKYQLLSMEAKINLLHIAKSNYKFDAIKILLESDSTINFEYQDQVLFNELTDGNEQINSQFEYTDLDSYQNNPQNLLGEESILGISANPDLV